MKFPRLFPGRLKSVLPSWLLSRSAIPPLTLSDEAVVGIAQLAAAVFYVALFVGGLAALLWLIKTLSVWV